MGGGIGSQPGGGNPGTQPGGGNLGTLPVPSSIVRPALRGLVPQAVTPTIASSALDALLAKATNPAAVTALPNAGSGPLADGPTSPLLAALLVALALLSLVGGALTLSRSRARRAS